MPTQSIPQTPQPQQQLPHQSPPQSPLPDSPLPDSTPPTPPSRPPRPKQSNWESNLSTLGLFIAAPLVALLLTTFIFHPYEVDGPSMQPTLEDGDRLIVLKTGPTWASLTGGDFIPKRGDIIVFEHHDIGIGGRQQSKQLIKRVIGLPGERVIVRNGMLTVFNQEFPQGFRPDQRSEYGHAITTTSGDADYTLDKDELFVSGDNRSNSQDSRNFGPIKADDIIGTLELRIYPFNSMESF